jgi:beta-lactamase superfamily II metal-dependent hydrolase
MKYMQCLSQITGYLSIVSVAATFMSCMPDTQIPEIPNSRGVRVCSLDELNAFRDTSTDNERTDLWIAFVDVGQGDATWIRTPGTRDLDAKDILVDSGNCIVNSGDCGFTSQVNDLYDSDGVGALINFMRENSWIEGSPIDYLVATHPDKDHYGGTWKILQNYRVGAFISSGLTNDNKTYSTALSAVNQESNLVNLTPVVQTGLNAKQPTGELETESWGRNVTVRLLSAQQFASKDNDASVVLSIEFQGIKILLTGDAEDALDDYLLKLDNDYLAMNPQAKSLLKSDVLKAGHHGGQGTNTQSLLDRVFPPGDRRRYAIVSAGRRENLPATDTMERLLNQVGEFGLYRTDRLDDDKNRSISAGDDHILLRVSAEGDLTLCYAYPDEIKVPTSNTSMSNPIDPNSSTDSTNISP